MPPFFWSLQSPFTLYRWTQKFVPTLQSSTTKFDVTCSTHLLNLGWFNSRYSFKGNVAERIGPVCYGKYIEHTSSNSVMPQLYVLVSPRILSRALSRGLQVTVAWGHGWRAPKRAETAHAEYTPYSILIIIGKLTGGWIATIYTIIPKNPFLR